MKKRYKLIIGFIIVGIILLFIYFITLDKKIYYLSLGDSLAKGVGPNNKVIEGYGKFVSEYLLDKEKLEFYTNKFAKKDYRSIDILNDLKENKKINQDKKEITIRNALIKADVVTISVGTSDLFYKLGNKKTIEEDDVEELYCYVDEVISDTNKLLYELRQACKEQIMVLGYYNPFTNYSKNLSYMVEPLIKYANTKLESLVLKYDMTFVNIHDMFIANDNYLSSKQGFYPTKDGYRAISKEIIALIDEKKLAK